MAHEDIRHEPITRTVGRVIDDVRELFREEVALAKAELRHEMSAFTSAMARMGIGAGAGLFALGFLLLGLTQAAADLLHWPAWAGYLAMAVLLGIVAVVAIQSGRRRVAQVPTLPKTTASIKETKAWMTDRMSSNTR